MSGRARPDDPRAPRGPEGGTPRGPRDGVLIPRSPRAGSAGADPEGPGTARAPSPGPPSVPRSGSPDRSQGPGGIQASAPRTDPTRAATQVPPPPRAPLGSIDPSPEPALARLAAQGVADLHREDPELGALIEADLARQQGTLALVAASSLADPSVLACTGSPLQSVTTEGYPGARLHAGCNFVDGVERLAIERARSLFAARHANVQAHSGALANAAVLFALLEPGDVIQGLSLDCGGHFSHGSSVSVTGRYFRSVAYGLGPDGRVDLDQVRDLALRHRPRLLVCGASVYPRTVDYRAYREIADEVGAWCLADISHVAGLVAAGAHPSPVDHAHVTTTSTYKQLHGPRGGLILLGRDAEGVSGGLTLAERIDRAVFPHLQGTPDLAAVAAKARAFAAAASPGFREIARRVVAGAQRMAEVLAERGWPVVTGGTDNHMVVLDVLSDARHPQTGLVAQEALEACGLVTNKVRLAEDPTPPDVGAGLRLGTNVLAQRGLDPEDMGACAVLVDRVLRAVRPTSERSFELDGGVRGTVGEEVGRLCARFPLPGYPSPQHP